MWIKNIFLLFFGLCSGGIIAAGVYAFLAIIGVFVRLIGKRKKKKKQKKPERCFCADDRENEDKEKYHAL